MTGREIERKLKDAVEKLTPDRAEEIWNAPLERASGEEWYLDGISGSGAGKEPFRKKAVLFGAAAVLILLLLSAFAVRAVVRRPQARVYLDVNPSIQLIVGRMDKVLSAKPENEDGKEVLSGLALRNVPVEEAVDQIVAAMVSGGFLNETQHAVLVSVESRDAEISEHLRDTVSEEVDTKMRDLVGISTVYDQTVENSDDLEMMAEEYGMTIGKAALIRKMQQDDPTLSEESLSGMNMNELDTVLDNRGRGLDQYTRMRGEHPEEVPPDDGKTPHGGENGAGQPDPKEHEPGAPPPPEEGVTAGGEPLPEEAKQTDHEISSADGNKEEGSSSGTAHAILEGDNAASQPEKAEYKEDYDNGVTSGGETMPPEDAVSPEENAVPEGVPAPEENAVPEGVPAPEETAVPGGKAEKDGNDPKEDHTPAEGSSPEGENGPEDRTAPQGKETAGDGKNTPSQGQGEEGTGRNQESGPAFSGDRSDQNAGKTKR